MGKLGWTEYEYYTCSPYMFLAACEGYLDKEGEQSALLRLQTYYLMLCFGAKKLHKPEDLWWILGEDKKEQVTKTWGSKQEADDMRKQIEKAFGVKLYERH